MKLKKVLGDNTDSARCFRKHPRLQFAAVVMLAAQLIPNISWAQAQPAPPLSGVLGKVQSLTGSSLDVATPAGVVHVTVTQPLATYKQIPSDLSHVTSNSYVGVASVQQADGTELAKQAVTLSAGDTIYAATEKLPDGMLTTNKILQIAAASPSNVQ